jgi:hypothetical protein
MSKSPKTVTFDEDSGEVQIKNFVTSDSDITNYFSDIDPEEKGEKLETALRVGVLALRSSETVEDVDYVEKRFNELQQSFNDQIDDLLGEEGDVPEYVDNHFGDDGKLVNEVFDPDSDETPIGKLRTRINSEIQQLRTDLEVAEKKEEMVESTRLKGEQFENDLYDLLAEIAPTTGDKIQQTGEKSGLLGDSKKGDFVIDLNDVPTKIAVEAKDTYYSQPQIEEEMEEAIENRGASYGLFVARNIDNVPNHVGWFNEYNQNQLVVALSDGDDESMADEILTVGYKWARMRVLEQQALTGDEFDSSTIQEEIDSAERSMKSFQNIKRKCTAIRSSADDIEDEADDIQTDLEENLELITDELTKAN